MREGRCRTTANHERKHNHHMCDSHSTTRQKGPPFAQILRRAERIALRFTVTLKKSRGTKLVQRLSREKGTAET